MHDNFDLGQEEEARQTRVSERRHTATAALCALVFGLGLSIGLLLGHANQAPTSVLVSPERIVPEHAAVTYPACTLTFC
ncbi:hypothetical protein FJY93_03625 [Candidatus Kaiserbacteria bacterium]|nr:hypothetical protein [Candidatus Kaiserbacteria bacterium]